MRSLTALAKAAPELDAVVRTDDLIRLLEEQIHLQKVALLEQGQILRFHHGGVTEVALALPQAQEDYLQRLILKARGFAEARLLAAVEALGLIGPKVTVCDIGAHIGNHTVFFGKVLGARRVLAFEPLPMAHATLLRNIELNGLGTATAYNCMVGAASGRGRVDRFNPRNTGGTTFVSAKEGPVPMIALDDLLEAEEMEGLGFLKIDTGTMQLPVLVGAKKLLKALKPAVWMTLRPEDKATAEAEKILTGLGYRAQRIGPSDQVFIAR
ncbi:MAG: FkbM family methyltransferase [Cypionkella sp.]|nr:FkbM family methyltransferase [Cypionkella sp.]